MGGGGPGADYDDEVYYFAGNIPFSRAYYDAAPIARLTAWP